MLEIQLKNILVIRQIFLLSSNRQETVINGCKFIEKEFGINDKDIIITHDSVRPFVTQRIIDDNIKALKKGIAVDTVIPATDTIVESTDGKVLSNIPVRKNMYLGQTPQSFNLKELMTLFESLTTDEKNILTDACKAFILKGKEVKIVEGEIYNIKITTLHDLKISNAILAERKEND